MVEFNKYSKKCTDYITNNIANIVTVDIDNSFLSNKIIKEMRNIISNVSKVTQYNTKTVHIEKLSDSDKPIIYLIFIELHKENTLIKIFDSKIKTYPDVSDFNAFVKWYRQHHHLLKIDNLFKLCTTSKNKTLIDLYSKLYNINNERSDLHEALYKNPFVSLDIQHYTESINMTKFIFKSDNGIKVIVYSPFDSPNVDINKIFSIINAVKIISDYSYKLKKEDPKESYPEIVLFTGKQRKAFSIYDDYLCADNINSGSTTIGKSIAIWRREEMYKVLIHELIHFYEFDFHFHDEDYPIIETTISGIFNIIGIDRSNESYTEGLANIIHILWIAEYTDVSKQQGCSDENILSLFKTEITFTLFQIAKIMKYYKINNINEILNGNGKKSLKQTTSVLSYFVIKGLLMFSINEFTDFLDETLIIGDKISKYAKLIKKISNKQIFYDNINKIIEIINLETINKNSFIETTLRMTCLQID
jgi:hypothetical protein